MRVAIFITTILAIFSLSCNAIPASNIEVVRRGTTPQQQTSSQQQLQQRTSAAQSCVSQLNLISGAKQYCINVIFPNGQTTTLTTTSTPVTSISKTNVATVTSTYSTTTTVTPISSVTVTTQPFATEHDTLTDTISTVYVSSSSQGQRRRSTSSKDPLVVISYTFPQSIIQDACLLFLYGSLQSPLPKTTTVTQTAATSTATVIVSSTTQTTISTTVISTAPVSTITATSTLSTVTVTTTDATTSVTATQTIPPASIFNIQFSSNLYAHGAMQASTVSPGDGYKLVSDDGFDNILSLGNTSLVFFYQGSGQLAPYPYDTGPDNSRREPVFCSMSGGTDYGDSGTLSCNGGVSSGRNTFYLCGSSAPYNVYIGSPSGQVDYNTPPYNPCLAVTATYSFLPFQPT